MSRASPDASNDGKPLLGRRDRALQAPQEGGYLLGLRERVLDVVRIFGGVVLQLCKHAGQDAVRLGPHERAGRGQGTYSVLHNFRVRKQAFQVKPAAVQGEAVLHGREDKGRVVHLAVVLAVAGNVQLVEDLEKSKSLSEETPTPTLTP